MRTILKNSVLAARNRYDRLYKAFAPPTFVLTYHRVTPYLFDPHQLCVTPERFEAQLRFLNTTNLASSWADFGDFSRTRVFLTFDDGYRDNVEVAAPLLGKWNCEAVFFISTRLVQQGGLFWWDELALRILHAAVSRPPLVKIRLEKKTKEFRLESEQARSRAHAWLHAFLKRKSDVRCREEIFAQLRSQTGVIPKNLQDAHAIMNVDQLRLLARSPGCRVGAHTLHHPCLRALSQRDQESEIVGSRAELARLSSTPIDLFSYPFGSYLDFDSLSRKLAKQAGYRFAFSNIPGTVKPKSSPFSISRFTVRDWTPAELQRNVFDNLINEPRSL